MSTSSAKQPKKLDGLTACLFQHASDRAILRKLEAVPVFPALVGKILDEVEEEVELDLLSDAFQVTSASLPEVYDSYHRACDTLCVVNPPPLYIEYSPVYNAHTTGVDKAFIVVNSALAADLDGEELSYVLGHELGHYLCGHVKYQTFVQLLVGKAIESIDGVAKILADATFGPLLFLWSRRAEYSADRAGLLACQDPLVAHRANLLLAGCPKKFQQSLPPEVFIEQARVFEERASRGLIKNLVMATREAYRDHPRLVERSSELSKWVEEGWYADIVDGTAASRARMSESLEQDPLTAEMLSLLIRNIAKCCAAEFSLGLETVAPLVRRAVWGGESLKGTLLEPLLRIEWIIEKEKSVLRHYVGLLVYRKGDAVRLKFDIPMPERWEDAPSEIRRDLIDQGGKPLVRVLYSV